jgi:hypothetical protein
LSTFPVPAAFNETRSITVTVYNLLFLSILLPAIDAAMSRGKDAALVAYSACVFAICSATILILIAPKLVVVYKLKFGSGDFSGRLTSQGNHTRVTGDDSSLTAMDAAAQKNGPAPGQRQSIGGVGAKPASGAGRVGGQTTLGMNSTTTPTAASATRRASTQLSSPTGRSSTLSTGSRLPAPLPVTRNPKLSDASPPVYDGTTAPGSLATPQRAGGNGPAGGVQLTQISIHVDGDNPSSRAAVPVSPRSALRLHLPVAMADDLTLFVQHKQEFMEWKRQQEAAAAASPSTQ